MASTDPSGAGAAALQALQTLAQTAFRTLHAFLHGLLHLPHPARLGRGGSRPPATGARPDPARRDGTTRTAEAPADAATPGGGVTGGDPPPGHGLSRVVVVARDPWSLFAHWDIPAVRRVEVLRGLGADGEQVQETLRLYDTTSAPAPFRDLALAAGTGRALIDLEQPGRTYRVEVGLRTASGRFVALATSTPISTPAAQPSDDASVRWVALGPDGTASEVTAAWDGRRVTTVHTATALDTPPGAATARGGSSEALPPGPRASDALPIR